MAIFLAMVLSSAQNGTIGTFQTYKALLKAMLSHIKHSDEKQRWLLASTLLNTTLAITKITWGLVMESTLVTADGIHSISDVFSALLILLALYFSAHRSERFPYGLHKLEDMAALLGGLGILFAGYEIIHSVFFEQGIRTPESIWSTIGFIAAILLIQTVFYYAELKAARRLNSPGVRADAINWLGDIGAGLVVIFGLVAHHYAIPYAQEAAVMIIILMIFQGAFDVFKEALLSLLDAADMAIEKKVRDLVIAEPGVTQIKRLTVRKSGSVYFANIELSIAETSIIEAHKQIDNIVDKLHKEIEELESVTIHYEPDHPPYQTIVELLAADKKTLSNRFGATPWLHVIKKHPDGSLISNLLIENTSKDAPKGKAFLLAAWLISRHTDTVIMGQADLDENIVALFKSLGMTLKQVATDPVYQ
ncbi:Cobalt-zinc-cadmium resistance protein [hydrothermal vent metagenome]|uniref:Cobalt-zinc-cadmium resistance protein n=1 Tax=hydrothermal vent metagenome TaxID=652676 RepID=A0A3B1B439_9ZZZZ